MTLHYFPLYVRVEAVRMLLHYKNVEFTDNVISFADWGAAKPGFPNGQVPCLELGDGTKLGQSLAILRLLGKQHGMYPADAMAAYHVDSLIDEFNDTLGKIYKPAFFKPSEDAAE